MAKTNKSAGIRIFFERTMRAKRKRSTKLIHPSTAGTIFATNKDSPKTERNNPTSHETYIPLV
jgi:hypothetical protein